MTQLWFGEARSSDGWESIWAVKTLGQALVEESANTEGFQPWPCTNAVLTMPAAVALYKPEILVVDPWITHVIPWQWHRRAWQADGAPFADADLVDAGHLSLRMLL